MVPCIILKPEEEEEDEGMTPNPRTSFKERQRKHLFEAILAALHLLRGLVRRFLKRIRSWMLLGCRCPLLISLGLGKNWF